MHKVTSALCLLLSQVFIPVLFPPQAACCGANSMSRRARFMSRSKIR